MNFALLILSIPASLGGEPVTAQNIFELHDLSGLPSFVAPSITSMVILPTLVSSTGQPAKKEEVDLGTYVEIFGVLASTELQSEGRNATLDDGTLRLRAPEQVQNLARSTFGFLGDTFGAETELWIESVSLPKARGGSASVVTDEEAEELIASATSRLGSWRCVLGSSDTRVVDTTRVLPFLADYNVEIAQGSLAYDPIILPVSVGTRAVVAAAPAPQGTWIALVIRSADPVGEVRDTPVDLTGMVSSSVDEITSAGTTTGAKQGTLRALPGPRKIQALTVQDRSLILNTYLPEGRALVVTTQLESRGATGSRALILRRKGPSLPLHAVFGGNARESAPPQILAIDLSSAHPPVAGLVGDRMRMLLDYPLDSGEWMVAQITHPATDVSFGEIDELLARAPEASEGIETSRFGSWSVLTAERGLTAIGVGGRSASDPLELMQRLRPRPRLFQVSATLSRGGAITARCALPIRLGASSSVALGTEDSVIYDADVEVAQWASEADPTVHIDFEGLIVRFEPRAGNSGATALDIAAWARVTRGESREFDSGSPFLPKLRHSTADRLVLDERIRFEAGAGPQKIRLGDRSESGEGLMLEIEMSEVR